MNRREIDRESVEFGDIIEEYSVSFMQVRLPQEVAKEFGQGISVGCNTNPHIFDFSTECIFSSAGLFAKELARRIGVEAALEAVQSILTDKNNCVLRVRKKEQNGEEED